MDGEEARATVYAFAKDTFPVDETPYGLKRSWWTLLFGRRKSPSQWN
jgi:hypothetical protein